MEPHECSMTLHVAKLLCTLPQTCMTGLKELAVHPRRDLWAGLHPEVVTEVDNVDVGSNQPEVFRGLQVQLRQTFEYVVGTVRFHGEQGQEVVVPIQELAPFHQVAAEHAQYRPVGAFAQTSCALHEQAVAAGPSTKGPGRGILHMHSAMASESAS